MKAAAGFANAWEAEGAYHTLRMQPGLAPRLPRDDESMPGPRRALDAGTHPPIGRQANHHIPNAKIQRPSAA